MTFHNDYRKKLPLLKRIHFDILVWYECRKLDFTEFMAKYFNIHLDW